MPLISMSSTHSHLVRRALLLPLPLLLFVVCLTSVLARPTEPAAATLQHFDIRQSAADDNSSGTSAVNASDWLFTQNTLNQTRFSAQPYVANGYIGARLPAVGVGFQSYAPLADNPEAFGQGWPLFGPRITASIAAGFYDVQNSTLGTNFAQNGGEQVISLLPSWPHLYLTVRSGNDNTTEATYGPGLNDSQIVSFNQSLSIRNGTVTTDVQWQPQSFSEPIVLRYTVLAHRSRASLGLMRLTVLSGLGNGTQVTITDALDGQGAARTQNGTAGIATDGGANKTVFASVEPLGVPNVTAYVFSALHEQQQQQQLSTDNVTLPTSVASLIGVGNETTVSQSYTLSNATTIDVWKAVGIASSDAYGEQARQTALSAVQQAGQSGWDTLVQEHVDAWETVWDEGGDIVIEQSGNDAILDQLQRQARASLFHILSNVRRGEEGTGLGDNSIAPAGLTSDSYAGSIFWDAETFMFPSLSLLYPAFAESMLNYRHKVPGQPERNAQQYGKPGLLYPWVSARYQNCTGIGPCYDYEYHLNNDIALAHWQYYLQTDNTTFLEQKAWPIMEGVSRFWAAQVVSRNATSNETAPPLGAREFVTLNLTDPDEYANFKNNGAFTNAGLTTVMLDTLYAATLLNKSIDSLDARNWSSVATGITLLRENASNIVLEYEGFNSTVEVKQADVPLLIYPLGYNDAFPDREPAPRADLDYYAGATDAAGPGMTYSIYGIASTQLDAQKATQVGPTCEGFTRLLQAGVPYEREFGQFSEQINDDYATNGGSNPAGGVNPAYTFLTGHGGLLQMYTHGFLGYRARNSSGHSLFLDPNLPPQFAAGLTIRGVHHGDSVLDVALGNTTTTVTHRNGTQPVIVESNNGTTQSVAVGSSIQLATRTLASLGAGSNGNTTNYALCAPIDDGSAASSSATMQETHAGTNLPYGANDGSNATYFQPATANASSSLVIDLGAVQTLRSAHFNFGQLPPQTISISGAVDNATAYQTLADNVPVSISAPYNASDPAVVAATVQLPTAWNTTDVALAPNNATVQARYVNITIQGVATPQPLGVGATLLEVQLS